MVNRQNICDNLAFRQGRAIILEVPCLGYAQSVARCLKLAYLTKCIARKHAGVLAHGVIATIKSELIRLGKLTKSDSMSFTSVTEVFVIYAAV